MKKELVVVSSVDTLESKRKAADLLLKYGFFVEKLFLPFPMGSEFTLKVFASRESVSMDPSLSKPGSTQRLKVFKPIINLSIKFNMETHCYEHPEHYQFSLKVAEEILLLTFRARVGKVPLKKWREAIKKQINSNLDYAPEEAEYIVRKSREKDFCFDANQELIDQLEGFGLKVKNLMIEPSLKPLDILADELRREVLLGEQIPDERVRELVSQHLDFVDLILKSKSFEDAYYKWKNTFKWERNLN